MKTKLISKNPIQRFANSGKVIYQGEDENGNPLVAYSSDNKSSSNNKYIPKILINSKRYNKLYNSTKDLKYEYKNGSWYNVFGQKIDEDLNKGYEYKNGSWYNKYGMKIDLNKVTYHKPKKTSKKSTSKSTVSTPTNQSDTKGRFWNEYSQRQSELNGKSVIDIQNELNKHFANDKDYVALKTDNIWGDKTELAYQRYLSENNTNNQTNNTQQTNTPNTPSTTYTITEPYTLKYNYNNSLRDISKLGFNNYAGLVNFAKASNHPLAQDLRYVFGDPEKWNQNEVESALRIGGHYGRGFLGNGDFSDIIRNIQNLYAIKRNDQEMKQIAPDNINPQRFDFVKTINNWLRENNYDRFNNFNKFKLVEPLPDITNSTSTTEKPLFAKKGGIISRNPIQRFKQNLTKIKF